MLKINMKYRKGTLIVEISGYLTRFTSFKLRDYLVPIILKHEIKFLVYNTDKLKKIDKYGLSVIKEGIKAIKGNSGHIYYSKNSKILKLNEG